MIKLFHKLMTAALPVLLCGTLLTGCTDDKYNKIKRPVPASFRIGGAGSERQFYQPCVVQG